jgi:hypothetical protein
MVNPNLAKIKEDFDKVIQYSQSIPDPKTDRLFDVWLECKRDFIELFGGKYIYEFPEKVSFDLGPKEKHDRVIRFAGQVASQWGYTDLANFIECQEDGFFQNLTVEDYTAWDGKVIHKGSKLVRSFRHFIKNNDRSLFDIQNEASRIIQEDKIEGTLCLSVHPLDFLSLSENTYNWRSCHSLDGEYRAGNLSYMMDKHTVICYLKGADDVTLAAFHPDVKWNSKKWRVLLYLSSDWNMIFAGRQYPFESKTGMDIVLKEMLPAVNMCSSADYNSSWSDWNNTLLSKCNLTNDVDVVFADPYIPVGVGLMPLSELFAVGDGAKNYNDVLYSSCYKPIYAFKYRKHLWQDGGSLMTHKDCTKFNIGGFTYCLRCGEEECLTGADTMMCEACELEYGTSENDLFTTCDSCGRRIYTDDAYTVGDEGWCQHCFDQYARRCEYCGDSVCEDQIHYHEPTQQYVCEYCLEELNEE